MKKVPLQARYATDDDEKFASYERQINLTDNEDDDSEIQPIIPLQIAGLPAAGPQVHAMTEDRSKR